MPRSNAKPQQVSPPLPILLSHLIIIITSLLHEPHRSNAFAVQPISAVVVLVLENRSFDHMLGWMKQSVNPAIDGLTGRECNPHSTQDPNSQRVCISDDTQFVDPDPGHSFEDVMEQVFGSGTTPIRPAGPHHVQQSVEHRHEGLQDRALIRSPEDLGGGRIWEEAVGRILLGGKDTGGGGRWEEDLEAGGEDMGGGGKKIGGGGEDMGKAVRREDLGGGGRGGGR